MKLCIQSLASPGPPKIAIAEQMNPAEFMKVAPALLLLAIGTQLSGCAVTMVAGSTADNEIEVTLTNGAIPEPVRSQLRNAKTLGVISSDRSSIKAADHFETRGGYTVTIDRQAAAVGEMTGSERRESLRTLCRNQRPDLALLGRIVKTETGSFLATAFTGRAKANQAWEMEVMACNTGSLETFGGNLSMNLGVYKANNRSQIEEAIGEQLGSTILASIKGDSPVAQTPVVNPLVDQAALAPAAVPAQQQAAVGNDAQMASSPPPISGKELQVRLARLGYSVGTPDGVVGPRTVSALKKFQVDHQLPATGKVDDATWEAIHRRLGSK